ncbi:MAG TPA: hypothetical protein VF584_06680 [Longimicrobium sp.]
MLHLRDQCRKPSLNSVSHLRVITSLDKLSRDQLRIPEQILIWVIKTRTWENPPLALD